MIPDIDDTLEEWSDLYIVKTLTISTVDFVKTETVTGRTISAVVQPADTEKLNKDQIDWSKKYLLIHIDDEIYVNEFVFYESEDYKVISAKDYGGYFEAVAEQTKKDVLVINA